MATFVVPVKQIEKVWPHQNADRLDMASVCGMSWQFVVGRGEYKPGDPVVFFPIDCVLPEALIDLLGIRQFLAGREKNRVKTARLRGEISQGLVVTLPKVAEFLGQPDFAPALEQDLAETLGVHKYDPPPIIGTQANLVHMPGHVSMFDVEGADNYPEIVESLLPQKVVVTEKLEGTNWWCSASVDGDIWVGQRSHAIEEKPGEENVYWLCARRQGLLQQCQTYAKNNGCLLTLRGELLGPKIQKNYYDLEGYRVVLFAAQVNGQYMPSLQFLETFADTVPVLCAGDRTLAQWLGEQTVGQAADGKTVLDSPARGKKNREGIVIVPTQEQRHERFGRLMIKQRSPLYLTKTDF